MKVRRGPRGMVVVCGAAALLMACGSHHVTRGADLYAGGHYIEAAEIFERTESRLDRASAAERARYGLYRGATLLALGDAPRADHWLRYTQSVLLAEADALSPDERVMLNRALGVIARRHPAGPPTAGGSAVARTQAASATQRTPAVAAEPGN